MLQVALLGAPATGKTQLAAALLATRPDLGVTVSDDWEMLARLTPEQSFPFDMVLLMGLDLPCRASHSCDRESTDALLRRALAQAGVSYKVIYGQGPERLLNALSALSALDTLTSSNSNRWVWPCDKCSDPQCERRLLSDLIAKRSS